MGRYVIISSIRILIDIQIDSNLFEIRLYNYAIIPITFDHCLIMIYETFIFLFCIKLIFIYVANLNDTIYVILMF